ncbi:hypothetical protein Q2T42_25800 [Leptolyngbya boryana CZ1]|uniref:Uncharacterized protein n=1 Tax=Leptolyngbya boryana CZ1 TaxID=3060204 RepID=A0AA97AT01_LEPBY|nr:hypothetical protein [Leptolyngbya boryana]WNZ45205.1 hypothetical protein Q2T42_25800 [Leptolyngbya boryana CZ1]
MNNETTIAVEYLASSAKQSDLSSFIEGVQEMTRRYGGKTAEEAMQRCFECFPALTLDAMRVCPTQEQAKIAEFAFRRVADLLEQAGLKVEEHFRLCDEHFVITHEAEKVMRSAGYLTLRGTCGNDDLDGIGFKRLGGWMHRLSKILELDGHEFPNSWGAASCIISTASGWIDGDRENCLRLLKECVFRVEPTTDCDLLLKQSRYDDRALMKLASLVEQGYWLLAQHLQNSDR